ncbi:uncharacterized protein LOC123697546 [Colias croceus]|uniref:uncharacterized protein LOC123697546 n=1 Tax=Colias crocea TaxID=72248 RepID=UPI001E27FA5E|nr:uncharacterized protein LOC123697546 [Colias croceus]
MRRSRNDNEFEFYVVQFLELPFEGIDDYVCVPNTWIILRRTGNDRAVVAYPKEKNPALIKERVKRKERYCDTWRFYMAAIKYQSNTYEIAEQWIATGSNQRLFIEKNADNLVGRETRRIPDMQPASSSNTNSRTMLRKPLPRISIKRPGPPELYKQLDTKHLKLNKDDQSSDASVTDAYTESEQPTGIQDNQSRKLAQIRTAAVAFNIKSITKQSIQTQRTAQNKEPLIPIIDLDGPTEVIEIENSRSIESSNQNNSASHCHLSSKTADASMLVAKPSTSSERTSQPNQCNNQEPTLEKRSLLSNFNPKLENVQSLAHTSDVSNNTQTTTHTVVKLLAMPVMMQTPNKKVRFSNIKRKIEKAPQHPSNLTEQTGSSSVRSLRSSENCTVVKITTATPDMGHLLKINVESANNSPLESQNLLSSTCIPKIRADVANELHNSRTMSTLQGLPNKLQPSVVPNLLKSIRQTLSAASKQNHRNEQQPQTILNEQPTEQSKGLLTSIQQNIASDKHSEATDLTLQKDECTVEILAHYAETSDSDSLSDEGHEATDRVPMETTKDSTCVSFASRSADSPTAPQNTTSINPTTHVRFKLEQQMLDNFAILFTEMGSVLRNTTDMYNNLRSSILETAQTYKNLLSAVELFNSIQNSTGNETFPINLRPEVRKSPEEILTEATASTSSSSQDQHTNDDANKPPEKSWRFVLPPEYDRHDTRWTLRYRRNLPGLVELMPQSGVFISYGDLKYCQHVSKDCTSLARRLLSAVFSRKALSVCSTLTEKAQAPVGTDARPELDDHACEVLLNFVLDYGLQQGWNIDLGPIASSIDKRILKIRIHHDIVVER